MRENLRIAFFVLLLLGITVGISVNQSAKLKTRDIIKRHTCIMQKAQMPFRTYAGKIFIEKSNCMN